MKKKISSKAAKRVGAVSLALTMALSTSAFAAQPNVIFLKGEDNQLHGFNLTDLAFATSGSALRVAYQKYIRESVKHGYNMFAQVGTGEEGKFVEYNPYSTSSSSFASAVQAAQPMPAEQVPTTYNAVTVVVDPVTGVPTASEVVEEVSVDNPIALEAAPIVATVGTTFETVRPFTLTPTPADAVVWEITGLPSEFKYDTATGAISLVTAGAPTTEVASKEITVKATVGTAVVTGTTTFVVHPTGTVVATITLADVTATVGTALTPVTAVLNTSTTAAVTWAATNLPAGIEMSAAGIISGTPTATTTGTTAIVSASINGVVVATKQVNFVVNAVQTTPTVTGVVVTTPVSSVAPGGASVQFAAVVNGTDNPAQTVTWTLSGASVDTTLVNGLLTVGANETSTEITVVATSTFDTTKSGHATITISATAPTVTSVVVTPPTSSVAPGGEAIQFTAAVNGENSPAQTVTWTLSGAAVDTTLVNGLLTVGANETATDLTVIATSTANTNMAGSATVTVTVGVVPTVTDIVVTPTTTTAALGGTIQFNAVVNGTHNPAQTVIWTVSGAAVATTTMSATGILTVDATETATELTVIATSTVNTNISGSAIVNVTAAVIPTVTSVVVTPTTTTAALGGTVQFAAVVNGTHNPAQTVNWTVSGAAVSTTTMSATGILTVDATETATELTVIATSTVNTNISGSAVVTIATAPQTIAVTSVELVSPTSIKVITADTSGASITTGDFSIVNDGTSVSAFTVTKVSGTEYTITLPTAVAAGKTVVVTTQGQFAHKEVNLVYEAGAVKGSVTGYAFNETKKAVELTSVAGVTVSLILAADTSKVVTALTDADGSYTFLNVPKGTYNVKFAKDGYATDADESFAYGVKVASTTVGVTTFQLKSTNTTIKSKDALVSAVEGTVVKAVSGTTAGALKASLTLVYGTGTAGEGIEIINTTTTTAVTNTSVITTANAITVTAQDGIAKGTYTILPANANDLAILGVAFDVNTGGTAGSVKLKNTVSGMSYRIGTTGTAKDITGTTVEIKNIKANDVIRVWTGANPEATGKFIDLTVALANIAAPASVSVTTGQEVKATTSVAITPITTFDDLKMYASTISTDSAFSVTDTAHTFPLTYVAGESKVALPTTLANGTYYLYVVHTNSGVASAKSASFKVDNIAPGLSGLTISRTAKDKATITFNSDETISSANLGYGYYVAFSTMAGGFIFTDDVTKNISGAAVTPTVIKADWNGKGTTNVVTDGIPTDGSKTTAYIIAIDKAGNKSATISAEVPAFISGIADGTYTIADKGTVTPGNGQIALQNDLSIKADDAGAGVLTTYSDVAPNYGLVKKLLTSLAALDTIVITDGKLSSVTHQGSTNKVLNLAATDISTAAALTVVSGAGQLKLTGSVGKANLAVTGGAYNYDFSELNVDADATDAQGKITFTGAQTANVPVKAGFKIVTDAGNGAKINNILFTGNTTTIQVAPNNIYNAISKGNLLTVDASGSTQTSVTIKFVGKSVQQAGVAVTGQPVAGTATTTLMSESPVGSTVTVNGGKVIVTPEFTYDSTSISFPTNTKAEITAGAYNLSVVSGTIGELKVNSAANIIYSGSAADGDQLQIAGPVTGNVTFVGNTTLIGNATIATGKIWTITGAKILTITSQSSITNNSTFAAVSGTINAFGAFDNTATGAVFGASKLILSGTAASFKMAVVEDGVPSTIAIGNTEGSTAKIAADSGITLTGISSTVNAKSVTGIKYEITQGTVNISKNFTVGKADQFSMLAGTVVNVAADATFKIQDTVTLEDGTGTVSASKFTMDETAKINVAEKGHLWLVSTTTKAVTSGATISLTSGSFLHVGLYRNFVDVAAHATATGEQLVDGEYIDGAGYGKFTVAAASIGAGKDNVFRAGDYKATGSAGSTVFTRADTTPPTR